MLKYEFFLPSLIYFRPVPFHPHFLPLPLPLPLPEVQRKKLRKENKP